MMVPKLDRWIFVRNYHYLLSLIGQILQIDIRLKYFLRSNCYRNAHGYFKILVKIHVCLQNLILRNGL